MRDQEKKQRGGESLGKCFSGKKGMWCQESVACPHTGGLEKASGGKERPTKTMRHGEREMYKYLLSSYLENCERDWEGTVVFSGPWLQTVKKRRMR